jgi:signal transduction histidine kinase
MPQPPRHPRASSPAVEQPGALPRTSRRSRLNRRLVAWFLLFSLVPLLVTNAVGYYRSSAIIEQLVERDLIGIAEVEAQHIEDRIDRYLSLLQAMGVGNDFLVAGARRALGEPSGQMGTVATSEAIERLLANKRAELPAFEALYLFAAGGRVIAKAGDPADVVTTLPPNPGIASLTSVVRVGPSGSQPVFRFVVPLVGTERRPVAFLGGTVSMAGFRDVLQMPQNVTGRIESFIVDQRGRPLFFSNPRADVDYAKPLDMPLMWSGAGAMAHYAGLGGVDVIGTVATIRSPQWRLIAEVRESDALGELRRLRWLSVALEMVFAAAVVLAAWIVAADIVAPLRRLVDATRRVARGDLRVRVVAGERDELGELTRSFNDMTSALAETTAHVSELHQHEIERASQLATVGELASSVAHEIKNPVVGVAHGLDMVRRHIGDDPALAPIMDEMARQLARVQGDLQGLLSFARPAIPSLAPVSAADLVDRAIRLVQAASERTGVRVSVLADPELPPFYADEEMLHQALVNLLINAVQATPAGGQIAVAARAAAGWLELVVADTGRGIAASELDLVFKPFYTTRHTGTGLGLSITREIAQRHGGVVTVESSVGIGTTVTLRLPIRVVDAEAELQEVFVE